MANRWVVVHAGHRDWYQMPIAFAEKNRLARFVTDWYTPLDKSGWRSLSNSFHSFPLGLGKRFEPSLPSSLVSDGKIGFLSRYLYRRFSGSPFRDDLEGLHLGKIAAREARRQNANLFASSYHGSSAFSGAAAECIKALFQVHPHPRFLRNLYQSVMPRDHTYQALEKEPEASVSESELKTWELESRLADVIICASNFSKRSLTESGISGNRVHVVHYGVDSNVFTAGSPQEDRPFTALFVGQKVARKSIGLLLDVWKDLRSSDARLVVAGGYARDDDTMERFRGVFEELPPRGLSGLVPLYQQSDVFVMPSVAEGFGHVYLEALACGTPVICTPNTGAADIIEHGVSGWVVPVGGREALHAQLEWCIQNRDKVRSMRPAARKVAELNSWAKFRDDLRSCLSIS